MAEVEMAEKSPEQREQSILNLICWIGAGLFLALIAYNLFAAGSVISTDGLFFTVVPWCSRFRSWPCPAWTCGRSARPRKPLKLKALKLSMPRSLRLKKSTSPARIDCFFLYGCGC